jgi:hypothetical protein
LFLPLAVDLIATTDGDAKRGNSATGSSETKLWIAGEITYESDGVI